MQPEVSTTITTVVQSVAAFGLVFTLWLAGVFVWFWRRRAHAARLVQRLGSQENIHGEGPSKTLQLWNEGVMTTTRVPISARKGGWLDRLNSMCAEIGWNGGAVAFLVLVVGGAIVLGTVSYIFTTNVLLSIGVGGGCLVALRSFFQRRLTKRRVQFDEQLVAALGLAARSLRAGHPLIGAFQMVAEEMSSPVREMFGEICGSHEMGVSIPDALQHAAMESHSDDMKLVAASVAIQSRTGGNLAELMDRLAVVVKERLRLVRRVRVLTAQTQFSKRVLLALPVIVFLLLNAIQPGYMEPLYHTSAGRILLGLAVCGLIMGAWLMDRLSVLKF